MDLEASRGALQPLEGFAIYGDGKFSNVSVR
jgi:hypothetical protein